MGCQDIAHEASAPRCEKKTQREKAKKQKEEGGKRLRKWHVVKNEFDSRDRGDNKPYWSDSIIDGERRKWNHSAIWSEEIGSQVKAEARGA